MLYILKKMEFSKRGTSNRMLSIAVAFGLGFFLSYVYNKLSADVLIYQSVGICNSVKEALPNGERLSRLYGPSESNGKTEATFHTGSPRKILLDCGANTASTVDLFRETYPGGHDFIIHSFEIDDRLAPYFAPYANHVLHCPMGVSDKNGSMTAYSESSWSPNKGDNNGADMQWGGGTLFVDEKEKADDETGGRRKLAVRTKIPTIDLSDWIKKNTRKDDYVIFKLDVEGAEFGILDKMLKDGTFEWIDKFYGEYHFNRPTDRGLLSQWFSAFKVKFKGRSMREWQAEKRWYDDFDKMHAIYINKGYGSPGEMISTCSSKNQIAITLLMSMNAKQAQKAVSIIKAYRKHLPVTLLVYGDFVELFPSMVASWALNENFEIGIRGSTRYTTGHLEHMKVNWVQESVVSSQVRLSELGVSSRFYFPDGTSDDIKKVAKSRGLTIIRPAASFPPLEGNIMDRTGYYQYRDVERIPKALRMIHEQLTRSQGGILTLDTDLPDTHLIIVFLLDYLIDNSGYDIVPLEKCIGS